MVKYIIFALISVLFSFAAEKLADAILSGQKISILSKINIGRFCIIAAVNLAVWLLCLLLHKSEPIVALLLCIGFDILLCIAAEDIKQKKISSVYLIILSAVSIAVTLIDRSMPWYLHIFGCAAGYFPLFIMRVLGELVTKKEVMGAGDVYLSGILGLMLGLPIYLICGVIATGVAMITVFVIRRKKKYDKMHGYPFSPFFLTGYTLMILFGSLIIEKYISFVVGGAI